MFYTQIRGGLGGRKFLLYKFRSMYLEQDAKFIAAKIDDPRITKVGKLLRATSLDELPQLYNVLIGDMSLVGPRPHAADMDSKYIKKIEKYLSRNRVKPGITGLAQINGFRGGDDIINMKQRIKYDVEYIKNWSFLMDLTILLKTLPSLFSKKAY